MANVPGRSARVLVDQYDLSSYLNSAETSGELALLENTAFGATARSYLVGLPQASIALGGFFDAVTAGVDPVLSAALGAASGQIVTVAPEGLASIGARVKLLLSRLTRYSVTAPVDGIVGVQAQFQGIDVLGAGVVLHPQTAETATGNDATHDNAVATSAGLDAHLHVVANTRNGTVDIKIQHSTDASVWTDLLTFTQVPASTATSERKSVSGTINRYLRSVRTVAGTAGSITYVVVAARRVA